MVKAKVFIFAKQFDGVPKEDDVKLIEEELPPIKDGEFLAEAIYLSVDPFIRSIAKTFKIGAPLVGVQVARITESKNPLFPLGKNVVGFFGWRTHTISNGIHPDKDKMPRIVDVNLGDLPLSLLLGVLGRPGHSAYFGFLNLCQPKESDTVVVSGAAGAVGSHVGQIAKIVGCKKVVGIVGSEEKGKWVVDELGFDHFINYKTENINEALKKLVPEGVDCYFDNVGGEISSTVINHMNKFGRVSICGAISQYNEKEIPKGFMCAVWVDKWQQAITQNLEWVQKGELKYQETVTEGFENMFKAFVEMLTGKNFGKAIVKV